MGLKKIVDDALKLTEKGGHKVGSSSHASMHQLSAFRFAGVDSITSQLIGTAVTTLFDGGCGGGYLSISVRQVKSCLVFEKTALPADSTAWVAGR